nr:hypothetical protein [Propionicimonas sp.]
MEKNAYAAAGSVAHELTLQQINDTAKQTAGGLWTVPTTSTIGYICTISWECTNPPTVCGF